MNKPLKSGTCVNCDASGAGSFCQACGQKLNIPRLNFKSFAGDIMDRVLGLEGMLPRTLKGLTINPGKVVSEYVRGNRRKYVNPVSYYFLIFGAYLLLLNLFNVDLVEMVSGIQDTMAGAVGSSEVSKETTEKQQALQGMIFKNLQFFALLQFPFIAWWSKVFFKKAGYNFLENIILPFYVFGHLAISSLFFALIFKFTGWFSALVGISVTMVYFCWAGYRFYQPDSKILGIIKVFMVYALSYICFLLLAGVLGVIYAVLTR